MAKMSSKSKKKVKTTNLINDLEHLAKIQDKEERLKAVLSPAESYILLIERILVWEQPYISAALLIILNVLFWLTTTLRIYYLVGIIGVVIIGIDFGASYLWPTVSPDASSAGDAEGWTEVHPLLMGVPELSQTLAEWWVTGLDWLDSAILLRQQNHPKFIVLSTFCLATVATIGIYIPGVYIAYFSVMGLFLWPCMRYHSVYDRLSQRIKPTITNMEQKLNIKRHPSKHGKGGRPAGVVADNAEYSSDEDISEFVPTLNPSASRALNFTDDASPGDELTPDRFTPTLTSQSHDRSHDHSDDDLMSDDFASLSRGIKEMPGFDDLDSGHTEHDVDDSLLSIDPHPETSQDKMAFVSSHFQDSASEHDDEDDMDNLSRGLSFADADVTSLDPPPDTLARGDHLGVFGNVLGQGHSTLMAAVNSPALTNKVSTLVSTTMSGLSALRETVVGRNTDRHTTQPADTQTDTAAAAADILETEFEFLDHEELDFE